MITQNIPNELISVLATALLLQVELGIDKEAIFDCIHYGTANNDTSVGSKQLLCQNHLIKLLTILATVSEERAPMRAFLDFEFEDTKSITS